MLYGKRDGDVLEGRNVNKGMFVSYSFSSKYKTMYNPRVERVLKISST
jgi:hypothetical protein